MKYILYIFSDFNNIHIHHMWQVTRPYLNLSILYSYIQPDTLRKEGGKKIIRINKCSNQIVILEKILFSKNELCA